MELDEFSKRAQVLADQVVEGTSRIVRAAALAADQVLVMSTPVDTGRARTNWIASVGAPSTELVEPAVKGDGAACAAVALQQAEVVIRGWKPDQGSIFVANNLPYIKPLDDGHSQQAPEGMTRGAIAAAQEVIQRMTILEARGGN